MCFSTSKKFAIAGFAVIEYTVSTGGFYNAIGIIEGTMTTRDIPGTIFFIPFAASGFFTCKEYAVTDFSGVEEAVMTQ